MGNATSLGFCEGLSSLPDSQETWLAPGNAVRPSLNPYLGPALLSDTQS